MGESSALELRARSCIGIACHFHPRTAIWGFDLTIFHLDRQSPFGGSVGGRGGVRGLRRSVAIHCDGSPFLRVSLRCALGVLGEPRRSSTCARSFVQHPPPPTHPCTPHSPSPPSVRPPAGQAPHGASPTGTAYSSSSPSAGSNHISMLAISKLRTCSANGDGIVAPPKW